MPTATAVLLATPNVAVAAGGTSPADTEAEQAVTGLLEAVDQLRADPIGEAESVDAAQTTARMQDHRVEVFQMRTETDTVFANPDGTLTRQTLPALVRMLKDGRWTDVDVDLRRAADGDVVAKAHPRGLSLSGRGRVPAPSMRSAVAAPRTQARDLVTLGSGDHRIAVQWKGGLPAPRLSGNTATYENAVPDGDLVVEATRTGFEQFLRLRRAPHDDAPVVLPVELPTGMTVRTGADGGVDFVDDSGACADRRETGEEDRRREDREADPDLCQAPQAGLGAPQGGRGTAGHPRPEEGLQVLMTEAQ